jgi:hypothetical protein
MLVNQLNGKLSIPPGRGTTFQITFLIESDSNGKIDKEEGNQV